MKSQKLQREKDERLLVDFARIDGDHSKQLINYIAKLLDRCIKHRINSEKVRPLIKNIAEISDLVKEGDKQKAQTMLSALALNFPSDIIQLIKKITHDTKYDDADCSFFTRDDALALYANAYKRRATKFIVFDDQWDDSCDIYAVRRSVHVSILRKWFETSADNLLEQIELV